MKHLGDITKEERATELWKAQEIAEKQGEKDFVCPLCGGKAWWSRSEYNGYIHLYTCHYNARGNKCGIGILHKCEEVKNKERQNSRGRLTHERNTIPRQAD